MRQRFKQAATGTLRFKPIQGPPITSATCALYDRGGGVLQAAASATLSTAQTTISAGVSAGAETVTVAAATGVSVGNWYWLGTIGGEPLEQVRVKKISSTTVTLAEPLRFDHASGQKFIGAEMTYALTAVHTATLGQSYRAVWAYTVGSSTYEATQLWDVVATVFRLELGPQDLSTRIPQDLREGAYEVFALSDLVAEAEEVLANDVARRGRRIDLIMDPAQFREAGILCVRMLLLERAAVSDISYAPSAERARALYAEELGEVLAAGILWYDEDEGLDIDSGDALGEADEENVEAGYYIPIG